MYWLALFILLFWLSMWALLKKKPKPTPPEPQRQETKAVSSVALIIKCPTCDAVAGQACISVRSGKGLQEPHPERFVRAITPKQEKDS